MKKWAGNLGKRRNQQPEYELQKAVCKYIDYIYPEVFYNGSAGGIWTSMSQAKKMKATGYKKGFPDLFLYEPRGKYCGLAIEVKVIGRYPSKDQKSVLEKLRKKGYKAEVCKGFYEITNTINDYMKL